MTNKHSSPDQLAKAAGVSESSGIQLSKGDAPASVNLPKRRRSEGQSQNKQTLIEKKPKLADKDNQKATPYHPQTVQPQLLPKKSQAPPALASRLDSGNADSATAVEPTRNAQYGNRPQGLTQQNAPPARPPPQALDPTDDELFIFVNGLENCLVTSGPGVTHEQRKVLGEYLVRRGVLARLEQRQDYLNIMYNKELAPKLASILHTELQKLAHCVIKAKDESKVTMDDLRRWVRPGSDASRKA